MGVTVIGGLIFSTILTLLLVPAYFSIAISIEVADRPPVPPLGRQRRPRQRRQPVPGGMMSAVVNLTPARLLSGHGAMTNGAPTRFNPAQPGARGMKVAATGLLVVMAAVFVAAARLEPRYPWLGYVKAFAEAAMVGGLADWFAVTALFRHPLGLPIPHTAIIPRNKDRIGDALATFLKENFLIPRWSRGGCSNIDVAGAAGRFLQRRRAKGPASAPAPRG